MSEEVTERYYVRRREFLNEDLDLPAFIIGIVQDTRAIPDDSKDWENGEITLDLADCTRRISFYFNMYNGAERAKSLRKISLVAEVVNAVREAIALEVESRNARPDKAKPKKTEAEPARTEESRAQVFTSHFVTLGL